MILYVFNLFKDKPIKTMNDLCGRTLNNTQNLKEVYYMKLLLEETMRWINQLEKLTT